MPIKSSRQADNGISGEISDVVLTYQSELGPDISFSTDPTISLNMTLERLTLRLFEGFPSQDFQGPLYEVEASDTLQETTIRCLTGDLETLGKIKEQMNETHMVQLYRPGLHVEFGVHS